MLKCRVLGPLSLWSVSSTQQAAMQHAASAAAAQRVRPFTLHC
eukprot:COSAG01_NODE_53266_length_340_cov_1.215768_1_plen_42_part_10